MKSASLALEMGERLLIKHKKQTLEELAKEENLSDLTVSCLVCLAGKLTEESKVLVRADKLRFENAVILSLFDEKDQPRYIDCAKKLNRNEFYVVYQMYKGGMNHGFNAPPDQSQSESTGE